MRIERLTPRFWRLYDLPVPPADAARALRSRSFPWLDDAVAAYDCGGIYGGLQETDFASLFDAPLTNPAREHTVPVCYELGPDLAMVATKLGLDSEAVVAHHLAKTYRCHAVGFSPGFPYLGYLSDALTGVPRLPQPRIHTEPGSVGITGRQTGIYPSDTPGGWPIIGRCPRTLADLSEGFFAFEAGDEVRFQRIDEDEFRRQLGQRLT